MWLDCILISKQCDQINTEIRVGNDLRSIIVTCKYGSAYETRDLQARSLHLVYDAAEPRSRLTAWLDQNCLDVASAFPSSFHMRRDTPEEPGSSGKNLEARAYCTRTKEYLLNKCLLLPEGS